MRFSEAINQFNKFRTLEKTEKTIKGFDLDLRQFCLWCRNPLITQVTPEHVVEYLNGMKELGWSPNTITIKATCFSQFFKFWARKGYPVLNYELIPHVKREYSEPRVADDEKIIKLLKTCDSHPNDAYFIRMKAMILLTADTGCRNGEICSFPLNIDTKKGEGFTDFTQYSHVIKTEKSRGKKPYRRVFWYDETNEAIEQWIKARSKLQGIKDTNALFLGVPGQGARQAGQRISVPAFSCAMRKLSRIAGVPYVNPHSLRHMFGNRLGSQGANNSTISDLMGHASLTSSFIYTHLNDKQMKEAHMKYKKKIA